MYVYLFIYCSNKKKMSDNIEIDLYEKIFNTICYCSIIFSKTNKTRYFLKQQKQHLYKIIIVGTKDSKNNQQSTLGHQSTSKTSLSKGNNDQSTTQTGSNKKDDGNQIASANNNGGGSKSTLSVVAE